MDKEYPIPLYYKIYADLKEKIAEGVFKPGDRIPSEMELCKIYGVSRLTIRRALEELRREGIIERTKGRGTFITGSKKEEQLTVLKGFTDEARNKGYRVKSRVLENKLIEVPVEARDAFKLEPKTLVVLLKRLRYINDEPVAIEWAYLNPNVSVKILNVLKEDMSRRSLYEFLREEVGLVLSRAIEVLEIVNLTEEDARLLEVPQKSCAVLRKRFTYTSENECVEYVLSLYRSDKFKFKIELRSGGIVRK